MARAACGFMAYLAGFGCFKFSNLISTSGRLGANGYSVGHLVCGSYQFGIPLDLVESSNQVTDGARQEN